MTTPEDKKEQSQLKKLFLRAIDNEVPKHMQEIIDRGLVISDLDDLLQNTLKNKQAKEAEVLIQYGAKLNPPFKLSTDHVTTAVITGMLDTIKLMQANGMDLALSANSPMLLYFATRSGRLKMVEFLCELGYANDRENKDVRNAFVNTAENIDCIEYLLGQGFDINTKNASGDTLLKNSINAGRKNDFIQYLIDRGANVRTEDNHGRGPLTHAVGSWNTSLVELLLKNGADVNQGHGDNLPIIRGCIAGGAAVIGLLIKHGANTNVVSNNNDTPLHLALQKNSIEMFNLFLQNSHDINAVNRHGQTVAHMSCNKKDSEMFQLIFEKSPNFSIKDKNGLSILSLAAAKNNTETLDMILEQAGDTISDDDLQQSLKIADSNKAFACVSSIQNLLLLRASRVDILPGLNAGDSYC